MAASTATASKSEQVLKMYKGFKKPHIPDVTPAEVYKRVQAKDPKLVLVDVRQPAEQEVSVLAGPTVTKSEWEQGVASGKYTPQNSDVVCYCTAGLRSEGYAAYLTEQGFHASNLEGCILGWTHAGLPLVELNDRTKTTKRVHTFGQSFALQADGYEAVYFSQPRTIITLLKELLTMFLRWLDPRRWLPGFTLRKGPPAPPGPSGAAK